MKQKQNSKNSLKETFENNESAEPKSFDKEELANAADKSFEDLHAEALNEVETLPQEVLQTPEAQEAIKAVTEFDAQLKAEEPAILQPSKTTAVAAVKKTNNNGLKISPAYQKRMKRLKLL